MLKIDHAKFDPIEKSEFPEIVERKGVGHPDSVCDGAADACSRALCKYYFENLEYANPKFTLMVKDKLLLQCDYYNTSFRDCDNSFKDCNYTFKLYDELMENEEYKEDAIKRGKKTIIVYFSISQTVNL